MLGGGIERGTSTLIVGAAGTGKSSLAAQFVSAAAARGQSAALFIFDESLNTLLSRTAGLGIDLREHLDSGRVAVHQVDPANLSPGEFAHAIRSAVERESASVVVIDSLNGYLNAMPGEKFLIIQLHELLTYLGHAERRYSCHRCPSGTRRGTDDHARGRKLFGRCGHSDALF